MTGSWHPLVFTPYLRPQIWGGRALAERFGKPLATAEPYGESWEISGHPHHISVVSEGPHAGETLADLCEKYPHEIFGRTIPGDGKFPLLIKLLDCHELLSVQVHPNDEQAEQILGNEKGKTEAWVVIDSLESGEIYAGLKPGMNRSQFEQHMADKTTGQALHRFRPHAGDCVFIPAGTIHTMGGGVLIAEVQQTSDATFRIFDWNRLDKNGASRALHLQESLMAIDFSKGPVAPVEPRPLADGGQRLIECPYFTIDRYSSPKSVAVPTGELSIWMLLGGSAELVGDDGEYRRLFTAGQSVLVPAAAKSLAWIGTMTDSPAQLLRITLPA
jgi:mannose-6-phosphate isomerase